MHAISSSHFPDLHIIKRVTSTDTDCNNPEMVKGELRRMVQVQQLIRFGLFLFGKYQNTHPTFIFLDGITVHLILKSRLLSNFVFFTLILKLLLFIHYGHLKCPRFLFLVDQ